MAVCILYFAWADKSKNCTVFSILVLYGKYSTVVNKYSMVGSPKSCQKSCSGSDLPLTQLHKY